MTMKKAGLGPHPPPAIIITALLQVKSKHHYIHYINWSKFQVAFDMKKTTKATYLFVNFEIPFRFVNVTDKLLKLSESNKECFEIN